MKTKKSTVIEVAAKLFAEQGFENTSVANICELANVSKGLVYHHFKSKDEILKEIFTLTTKNMVEMNKSLPNDMPGNKLVGLIETMFSQLENDKLFFRLNLNVMFQPTTKKLLNKQIKERSSMLFESIKAIFDEINPVQSTILSFIFIAEIDGTALDYLSVYENYPLEEIKEHLINKYKSIGLMNTGSQTNSLKSSQKKRIMIRKYKEKEIPFLLEIWEKAAAIAHPFLPDDFNIKVKKAMSDIYLPNSDTWVYEELGNILGFISMNKNEIGGLFVLPDFHSKGIGTSLVNHISQFHEELEVEVFTKNKIGKPFYEKCGFEVIKEHIQEDINQKVLRMRKYKT